MSVVEELEILQTFITTSKLQQLLDLTLDLVISYINKEAHVLL